MYRTCRTRDSHLHGFSNIRRVTRRQKRRQRRRRLRPVCGSPHAPRHSHRTRATRSLSTIRNVYICHSEVNGRAIKSRRNGRFTTCLYSTRISVRSPARLKSYGVRISRRGNCPQRPHCAQNSTPLNNM
jgi:hypothetical protein